MKVLLCKDIDNCGWLGDVVEVKDGYARNYLLPQGLATIPTEAATKMIAKEKARYAEKRKLVRELIERLTESVEGAEVVIAAKANEQGHLFGSVTQQDIADNLRAQGFEVTDNMVDIPEHIKEVGAHEVQLSMAADLVAKVNVVVVSQDAKEIDSTDEDNDK